MKSFLTKMALLHLFFVFVVACTLEDENPADCENTAAYLQDLKFSIEDFAAQSVCGENFECRSIAFGSKSCGGPWSYLVYSTSIDTLELINLVNEYNALELRFNLNCGAVSDCSIPNAPIGFNCQNNLCVPIF